MPTTEDPTADRAKSNAWVPSALCTAYLFAAAWPTWADDDPTPKPRVIEEIVVTAQATEQVLQDIPMSVSAIRGEFLRENYVAYPLIDELTFSIDLRFRF